MRKAIKWEPGQVTQVEDTKWQRNQQRHLKHGIHKKHGIKLFQTGVPVLTKHA